MRSVYSICSLILLQLIFLHQNCGVTVAADLVPETCQKANETFTVDYEFCVKSFETVPESKTADLKGLGTIAFELARAAAAITVSKIEALIQSKEYDNDRLGVCLSVYSTAAKETLTEATKAFGSNDYSKADKLVRDAMDASWICGSTMDQKSGDFSPLDEENIAFTMSGRIALAINYSFLEATSPPAVNQI